MKVFVTGATGFLGGRLVTRFLSENHEITCLVRSPEKVRSLPWSSRVRLVTGDLSNIELLEREVVHFDVLFHLAAMYDVDIPESKKVEMRRANVDGTRNILEIAWKNRIPKILYCSTVGALGSSGPPGHLADEIHSHDGRFQSAYVQTKHEAHLIASKLMSRGAPIVTVLPGAVYGPGDKSIISKQIDLVRSGKIYAIPAAPGILAYTHVDDVVEGMVLAVSKGKIGEMYILAGPTLTLRGFYRAIARRLNRRPSWVLVPTPALKVTSKIYAKSPFLRRLLGPLPLGPESIAMITQANWNFSAEKARKELGWKARGIDEGLAYLSPEEG